MNYLSHYNNIGTEIVKSIKRNPGIVCVVGYICFNLLTYYLVSFVIN